MLDATQTALISAAAAIAGGLLSGAYQHFRDWLSRPILVIDSEDSEAHRVEVNYKTPEGRDTGEVFIRAKIRNTGRRPAKNAQVFLTSLREVHTGGGTTKTSLHDAKMLPWSGWNFTPRAIPPAPGAHFFVDIVRVSKDSSGWIFCVDKLFASQNNLKDYRGTYGFELTATADNATAVTRKVNVSYNGDWKNLRGVSA